MAKKRRGRAPGSKDKKWPSKNSALMDINQLRAHISELQGTLAKKISEQRAYFEDQLSQLGDYVSKGPNGAKAVAKKRSSGKRAKAKPKYQSKKNKSVNGPAAG